MAIFSLFENVKIDKQDQLEALVKAIEYSEAKQSSYTPNESRLATKEDILRLNELKRRGNA